MNPRRKKRLTLAVALIGGVAAITSLLLYALNSNLNLFYTPSEIVHGKTDTGVKPEIGQRIRVGGMVTVGSMVRDPKSLHVEFAVHDSSAAKYWSLMTTYCPIFSVKDKALLLRVYWVLMAN